MHFKLRLQVVLALFVSCWLLLVGRLFYMQAICGAEWREASDQRRLVGKQLLPAIRGCIVDRRGVELARDDPAWGIAVHYQLLRNDPVYLHWLSRKRLLAHGIEPRPRDLADARRLVDEEIDTLWDVLKRWASPEVLAQRVRLRLRQVEAWRNDFLVKHGREAEPGRAVVREERECHAILDGLSKKDEIDIRVWQQKKFGFLLRVGAVEVSDSMRRVYPHGNALAHVVGYLGEISEEERRARLFQEETDWGGYRLGDARGRSGVEALAEDTLRGQRGQVMTFIDDRPPQRREPLAGDDVRLTIDADLQARVFEVLVGTIEKVNREAGRCVIPGGSVVVLQPQSRALLAMASAPSYDANTFRQNYDELARDIVGRPLAHRALDVDYSPGSIVKPITVLAAQHAGVITLDSRIECQGYFNRRHKKSFRCWRPAGLSTPKAHGLIDSQGAIRGSCNVFCFHLGSRMVDRCGGPAGAVTQFCEWFERFGVGRLTGVGLRSRAAGILPWPQFLRERFNRAAVPADPRNYAIGQGEVEITPLQAANIVATYATGVFRPVTLMADDAPWPAEPLPVDAATWQTVRRGMFEVVNDDANGTAPKARLRHPDFVLCGKSGSAETKAWPISYRVTCGDTQALIAASHATGARRIMQASMGPDIDGAEIPLEDIQATCVEWFPNVPPEEGRQFSHAWFIAFIQPRRGGQVDFDQASPVAIAAMLEFGGSGGVVAGPLCKRVAEVIIEEFPEYVEPGAGIAEARP